ncbi:MAG: 3-deoxy-manno-octulosonate cytidylyltransferase [Abditibacteriota bacterium]|nr:3-deoxy-manno-octulosonate cytidylyltransferase [Abditibacteriota bacterium]
MSIIVIPIRLGSTRLPRKALLDICGKPMIERVYENALKSGLDVYVATCDEEIYEVVEGFGGKVIMTRKDHVCGTDRIIEAVQNIDTDKVINIQGDEPLINIDCINRLEDALDEAPMASLMVKISPKDAENPNLVKVICDKNNNALYFSRAKLPFERNPLEGSFYGHIGVYGYTKEFLLKYGAMTKTPYEKCESLEQLRVLENGYEIKMLEVKEKPLGVDTSEDYIKVCEEFEKLLR